MWNMVFWLNLQQGRRNVNATSLNLWSTATMVLTHQLEVLHGQLTRLSQVKLNPKQSWSLIISYLLLMYKAGLIEPKEKIMIISYLLMMYKAGQIEPKTIMIFSYWLLIVSQVGGKKWDGDPATWFQPQGGSQWTASEENLHQVPISESMFGIGNKGSLDPSSSKLRDVKQNIWVIPESFRNLWKQSF